MCMSLYRFIFLGMVGAALVAAPLQVQADSKAEAKAHYIKAKKAFEKGDHETALAEYQSAYRLMPLPGFLFNIGQCYRNLKRPHQAVDAFRRYLKAKPDARNRDAVEVLIAELDAEIDLKEPLPGQPDAGPSDPEPKVVDPDQPRPPIKKFTPKPQPKADIAGLLKPVKPKKPRKPKPTSTPIYKKWWFWTIVGAVAVGGGVGVYFGVNSGEPDLPQSDLGVLDFSR